MGWLITQDQTRRELIANRISKQENEYGIWLTEAYCVRGNCLWRVVNLFNKKLGASEKYIALDLMRCDRGYGWGYKDMEESCGPHYYTCPLKYLDMTPEPIRGYGIEWRQKVRAYHAKMNRKFKIGEFIQLCHCKIPEVLIETLKPLRGSYNGITYRIPKRLIA